MSKPNLETWKNAGRGRVVLKRFDVLTGRERAELIAGGRTFAISPEERRANSDMAANAELDLFKNGTLVPIRLVEDEEDAAEIASNPNVLSDSDIEALFDAHWKTFDKKISEVTNPQTLERIREEADRRDATVKQMAVIERRLEELQPELVTSSTTVASVDGGPQLAPSSPNNPDPAGNFNPVTPS